MFRRMFRMFRTCESRPTASHKIMQCRECVSLGDDVIAQIAAGIGLRAFVSMRGACRAWRHACAPLATARVALAIPTAHPGVTAVRWLWPAIGDENENPEGDENENENENDGASLLPDSVRMLRAAARRQTRGRGCAGDDGPTDSRELAAALGLLRDAWGRMMVWERMHLASWAHLLAGRLRVIGWTEEQAQEEQVVDNSGDDDGSDAEELRAAIDALPTSALRCLLRRTLDKAVLPAPP